MTERPVYMQVQSSILIVAAAIIALSALFIITVQLLLQRFVLGPLSTLDNDIKIISRSDDLSRRMPEKGDEEITSLARALNHMLSELRKDVVNCLLPAANSHSVTGILRSLTGRRTCIWISTWT